jgi:hypothetical protein
LSHERRGEGLRRTAKSEGVPERVEPMGVRLQFPPAVLAERRDDELAQAKGALRRREVPPGLFFFRDARKAGVRRQAEEIAQIRIGDPRGLAESVDDARDFR